MTIHLRRRFSRRTAEVLPNRLVADTGNRLTVAVASPVLMDSRPTEPHEAEKRGADALEPVALSLTGKAGMDQNLQQIVDAIRKELGYANCSIFLVDDAAKELVRRIARGAAADPSVAARLKCDGPGLTVRAFRTGTMVNIGDVWSETDYVPCLLQTRSELSIPLKLGGRVLGVLDLQSPDPNAFSDQAVRVLTPLAERASRIIQEAELQPEAQQVVSETQSRPQQPELSIPLESEERVMKVTNEPSPEPNALSEEAVRVLTPSTESTPIVVSEAQPEPDGQRVVEEAQSGLQQLQAERKRYEDLFSNINEFIYTHDLEGRFLSVNPALARELGFQTEALLGRSIEELIPERFKHEFHDYLRLIPQAGRARGLMRVVDQEGRDRVIEYDSSVIEEDGKPVGVRGIARDATERVEWERRLRRQIEREALINRISRRTHETFDIDEILSLSVEELGRHLRADRCIFFRIEEEAGAFAATHEFAAEGISRAASHLDAAPWLDWLQLIDEPVLAIDRAETDPHMTASLSNLLAPLGLTSLLVAKVVDAGRLQAVLLLGMVGKVRDWDPEEMELVYAAASQVTISVRQAKLYRHSQEASEREAVINRISSAIHQSLDLDEVLKRAADELGFYLDADRCLFYFWSEGDEFVHIRGDYFSKSTVAKTQPLRWRDHPELIAEMTSGRTSTMVEPWGTEGARPAWEDYGQFGVRSVVYTPVVVDGRLAAVIYLAQVRFPRVWREEEIRLIEEVARHLAIALRQAELFRQEKRRIAQLEAINVVTTAMSQTLNLGEVLEQSLQRLCETLGLELGAIFLLDELTGDLMLRHDRGLDPALIAVIGRYRVGEGLIGLAAAERRLVVSEEMQTDQRIERKQVVEAGMRSSALLPLLAKDRLLGVLAVGYNTEHRFTQADLQLLGLMADQLSVAIEKAGLYESVLHSEEQYRSIFENASDGILVRDLESGRILSANRRAAEIFGYPLDEFVRLTVFDFGAMETQRDELRRGLGQPGERRYVEIKSERRTNKQGKEVILEGTASLQDYQGRPAVMAIFRDVTERDRLEREAAARARRVTATNEMLEAINSTLGLDEMLRRIVHTLHEVFGSDRSWLLHPADPALEVLRIPYEVTDPAYPGVFAQGGETPAGDLRLALERALATHHAVVLRASDPGAEAFAQALQKHQIRSQVAIALRPRGTAPWLMGLDQCSYDREWTEEERSLFEELAVYCTVALENVAVYQRVSESE